MGNTKYTAHCFCLGSAGFPCWSGSLGAQGDPLTSTHHWRLAGQNGCRVGAFPLVLRTLNSRERNVEKNLLPLLGPESEESPSESFFDCWFIFPFKCPWQHLELHSDFQNLYVFFSGGVWNNCGWENRIQLPHSRLCKINRMKCRKMAWEGVHWFF